MVGVYQRRLSSSQPMLGEPASATRRVDRTRDWERPGAPQAGEEEGAASKAAAGLGLRIGGDDTWGLDYMIHALTAKGDRCGCYMAWEIDWVPADAPRGDINPLRVEWMDVAGAPQIYPVFDAEQGFDRDEATGGTSSGARSRPDPAAPGTRSARR